MGILRDSEGRLVVAFSKFLAGALDVLLAEALALLSGLKMLTELGVSSCRVEFDSHLLVKTIQCKSLRGVYSWCHCG